MTSEELATAGISSTGEEIHEFGNVQSRVDDPTPDTAPDSGNREEGEIRSDEDLADVDADPKELVAAKSSKSYPPSFVFGESKVTADLIREYKAAGFFSCWRWSCSS
jgi:hypothetical protein